VAKKSANGVFEDALASFIRGSVSSAIVASLNDKKKGKQLMEAAMLGGSALAAGVTVEDLILGKGLTVAKKSKKKDSNTNESLLGSMLSANNATTSTGIGGLSATQQLLLGVLIGAAAAYVLGDEKMRAKLLKAGMKLYSGVASGFEELKEQMADVQAELQAEQTSGQ